MLAVGIEAVVELADSEQVAVLPRELVRCRFPLSDGGINPPWLLRMASDAVAALIRADIPTLVCCAAGMSRSCASLLLVSPWPKSGRSTRLLRRLSA